MYRHVPRTEILAALAHLRDLHRQIRPSNDRERYAFERCELVTKNLFSNLRRTGDHPTLTMLLEFADVFSLTIEGAHRLFGYDLDPMREYDLRLNGGRTHIERGHQGGCPGEVHRPLCMGRTSERKTITVTMSRPFFLFVVSQSLNVGCLRMIFSAEVLNDRRVLDRFENFLVNDHLQGFSFEILVFLGHCWGGGMS